VDLFEAIHTTRAIRRFKPDPVPDDLIARVLDAAIRAPSGGNSQPWSFVVVKDASLRRQVAEYYRRSWNDAYGTPERAEARATAIGRVYQSAQYLAEHMAEAPVFIMPCIAVPGGRSSFGTGSSIYPAVQNLMLAARGLGLGTVLTSLHKRYEAQVKALLGIPEGVETAALIPLGYPAEGVRFGPVNRRPVNEVTYVDRWGNAFPG
jgi:nitroreductase